MSDPQTIRRRPGKPRVSPRPAPDPRKADGPRSAPDPRLDSARIIRECLVGRQRSTDLLGKCLERYRDQRSAGLLHQLTMGVLRHRMALEEVLRPLLKRPLDDAQPLVGETLLIMAYSALFLDRIPAHARVSTAVEAARLVAGEPAGRFVNAVGRGLERMIAREAGRQGILDSLPPGTRHSIPDFILKRIAQLEESPIDEALLSPLSNPAPTCLRTAPGQEDRLAVMAHVEELLGAPIKQARFAENGILIPDIGTGSIRKLVPKQLVFQDEASQLVVAALNPQSGERIVEMCAGNGIKTTQVLEMAPGADLRAVDIEDAKLMALKTLCATRGLAIPTVVRSDARSLPDSWKGCSDAVLLDAPCSGIGTLRRRPEVRYVRRESDFAVNHQLQVALLSAGLDLLAPGGRLVYAVCSFAKEEGPDVINEVLAVRTGFRLVPTHLQGPFVRPDGTILTKPWVHDMDGFYVARIDRVD